MKSLFKTKAVYRMAGIAALVAVIVVALASCGNGSFRSDISLDGRWRDRDGMTIEVNGKTGTIYNMGNLPALWQSAYSKKIIKDGGDFWQKISRTGDFTWTGEMLTVLYYTANPTVAIDTSWGACKFNMDADGRSMRVTVTDSDGSHTIQYTKR